jgi:hypothetical protein
VVCGAVVFVGLLSLRCIVMRCNVMYDVVCGSGGGHTNRNRDRAEVSVDDRFSLRSVPQGGSSRIRNRSRNRNHSRNHNRNRGRRGKMTKMKMKMKMKLLHSVLRWI